MLALKGDFSYFTGEGVIRNLSDIVAYRYERLNKRFACLVRSRGTICVFMAKKRMIPRIFESYVIK
jgi:hypothetical protein